MDHNIFVARHPIFDRQNRVVAYEILFRDGTENSFSNIDGDVASRSVLNRVLMDFGLDKISNNKTVFINFTENLLMDDAISILPKDFVVLEILETCEPNDTLFERVKELKKEGFNLALDDYVYKPEWDRFLPYIDYVKVDFFFVKGSDREKVLKHVKRDHIKVLAEKVENYEEFDSSRKMGYDLFQGYYFCKPSLISTQKISENKVNYMMLIQELNKEEIKFDVLESFVKRDLSLTYKLLKFLNSSYFGLPNEITSVRNALTLLGHKELKKWMSLVALDSLIDDKPQELIRVSLSRALFCEAVSQLLNKNGNHESYFLMGLLSLVDAILDKSKEEAFNEIKISKLLYDTLMGEETVMSPYLDLTIALETDNFEMIGILKEKISITLDLIMEQYLNAISISDALLQIV